MEEQRKRRPRFSYGACGSSNPLFRKVKADYLRKKHEENAEFLKEIDAQPFDASKYKSAKTKLFYVKCFGSLDQITEEQYNWLKKTIPEEGFVIKEI